MQNGTYTLAKNLAVCTQVTYIYHTSRPCVMSIHPTVMKAHDKDLFMDFHSFIIVKIWKQPKCSLS